MTTTDLPRALPAHLTTEAAVVQTLRAGTWTLAQIYAACQERTDVSRNGGHDPIPGHTGDLRWKRRVRCALQGQRRAGLARRLDRTVWVIDGTPEQPKRLLLVVAGATPAEFELRLQAAVELLTSLDDPADLVLADPPWGLDRGRGHFTDGNGYRRDPSKVIGGYVEVSEDDYPAFTKEWVAAAAAALRPGGTLAVVTGPQRVGVIQCATEAAGMTWVASIQAKKDFPLRTTRQPSCAHWTILVSCRGPKDNPARTYHAPDDLPRAASGDPYPTDWWPVNGRADRRGDLIRYDNSLPLRMTGRVVHCFSNPRDLVVEPFVGFGTGLVACWQRRRRYIGGDVNPRAVRAAAARLLAEHAWAEDRQPGLYADPAQLLTRPDTLW